MMVGSVGLPTSAQALLPYTPELNSEQLEKQGLELAEDAVQLIRFQQYERALSYAKLSAQLAPNLFQTWFLLGSLYLQQQEIDSGIQVLEKALSLAPEGGTERAGIMFTLGRAYFQKENYSAAVKTFQEGLKLKPNTLEALFDLGNAYLKLGKFSEAIVSYEKAVTQEKKFWPALNNIGLIKYEQGDVQGAMKNWQAALAVDKEQAEPLLASAVALYNQGKKEQSLKMGEAALEIDSRYADLKFLKENLWGERLLKDTKNFLSTPQMQSALLRLQAKPPKEE
jgi:tetratricopeptide (TPR) repeat protein